MTPSEQPLIFASADDGAPSKVPAIGPVMATSAPVNPDAPIPLMLPSWRTLARWLLVVLALYSIGWLLVQSAQALTPFIIGLVLAYLLSPFVNRLNRRMPRWLAILTVYVAGIVLITIGIAYVVPPVITQTEQLLGNIPSVSELQARLSQFIGLYRERVPAALQAQIDPAVASGIETIRANIAANAQRIVAFVFSQILTILNTITFLIGFLIVPIWLFYILNDQEDGRRFVDRILHRRLRPDFWNTITMIDDVFSDYIRGQLVLCFAVGTAVGIGLFILRLIGIPIEYILLLAIAAGITEFIPILGPILGSIPGILIALATAGPQGALAALVVYVIVQQLENNILVPRIVGDSVGVHPAVLTIALIAMGQVFGLLGVILSAPITAIARDLFTYSYTRLGGAAPPLAMNNVQQRTKIENPEPQSVTGERKVKT